MMNGGEVTLRFFLGSYNGGRLGVKASREVQEALGMVWTLP